MTDKYLPWPQVREIIGGKTRVTVWRWYKAGLFPKPHKIGPNSIAWLESEVKAWVADRARKSA